MIKGLADRKKLQKKLLTRVKRGEIGAANAVKELEKKGFRVSSSFDKKLMQAQEELLREKGFLEKMQEIEREEEKAKEERERLKKMTDGQVIKEKKKAFEAAIRLHKKGELSNREMNKIGKALGLKDYYKWWEKYFQKK